MRRGCKMNPAGGRVMVYVTPAYCSSRLPPPHYAQTHKSETKQGQRGRLGRNREHAPDRAKLLISIGLSNGDRARAEGEIGIGLAEVETGNVPNCAVRPGAGCYHVVDPGRSDARERAECERLCRADDTFRVE